jgi:hypothetical protein
MCLNILEVLLPMQANPAEHASQYTYPEKQEDGLARKSAIQIDRHKRSFRAEQNECDSAKQKESQWVAADWEEGQRQRERLREVSRAAPLYENQPYVNGDCKSSWC